MRSGALAQSQTENAHELEQYKDAAVFLFFPTIVHQTTRRVPTEMHRIAVRGRPRVLVMQQVSPGGASRWRWHARERRGVARRNTWTSQTRTSRDVST